MDEILLVCTANICRSPFAEVLLRAWLDRQTPRMADRIAVSSAGVRARPGHPAAPHMVTIAERWGLDLHHHRSRPVTAEMVSEAALVVTMESDHRDAIARLVPSAATRTFTLPEAAALSEHLPPVGDGAPDPTGLWGLAQGLHRIRPRVWIDSPDVVDPYGGPVEGYDPCAWRLAGLVERIGPVLAAHAPTGPEPPQA